MLTSRRSPYLLPWAPGARIPTRAPSPSQCIQNERSRRGITVHTVQLTGSMDAKCSPRTCFQPLSTARNAIIPRQSTELTPPTRDNNNPISHLASSFATAPRGTASNTHQPQSKQIAQESAHDSRTGLST